MGQNNVHNIKLLGKGSYGEVHKAKWNGRIVAAKRIHSILVLYDPGSDKGAVARFVDECELLRRLKHPNIVQLIHVLNQEKKPPVLITELLDCDLSRHFEENTGGMFLEELLVIMLDVAKGLDYLHGQGIIHRDLCPKNILLDKSDPTAIKAKIADVGLAKILGEVTNELSPVPGTQAYMAPETFGNINSHWLNNLTYGTEIDLFSFGMTLLEGINGETPFPKENPLANYEESTVHSQLQADLVMLNDNPLRQLVFDCLEDNPMRRPTAADVITRLSNQKLIVDIVKYDFQTQKQKVIVDFHHWIPVRRRTIRELEELNLEDMTTALDEHHRKANIATAAGASTSVVATGLVIGGFVSSFFTFGATIPIMIAGGSIAAAGGITTFGAKMSEIVVSRTNINKVEDTIAEDKQESAHLRKSLEQLDKLIEKNVNRIFDTEGEALLDLEDFAEEGIANVMTHFMQITGMKIMETEQLNPLSSSARAVGAVLSATSTGVTAGTAGARIGTAVFDTLTVASRATHVAGLVASVLTLPIDAYFLVKSVRELRNHSPSEVADKIRGIQDRMVCPQEGEIPSLVEAYVKSKVAQTVDSILGQREGFEIVGDVHTGLIEHDHLDNAGRLSFD